MKREEPDVYFFASLFLNRIQSGITFSVREVVGAFEYVMGLVLGG